MAQPLDTADKSARYERLDQELAGVLEGNDDPLVAMVTINALIKKHLPYAYWVGFYRWTGDALSIGPYQGTLGCLKIPAGKGVCGASFAAAAPICVEDTHAFAGHIACDPKSLSEIVIPYYSAQRSSDIDGLQPLGVLDIDSDQLGSFNAIDELNLSQCLERYLSPVLMPDAPSSVVLGMTSQPKA